MLSWLHLSASLIITKMCVGGILLHSWEKIIAILLLLFWFKIGYEILNIYEM